MVQLTDVVLDGKGYMIVPGKATYTRMSDGEPEGRVGRVRVTDFFGGQRQALQLVRDRSWDAEGVGPAMFGQGLEPWPYVSSQTDGVLTTVTKGNRAPGAIANGYAWVGNGRYLFKSIALTAANWASVVQDEDFGAGAQMLDLSPHGDGNLVACFGSTLDIQTYNTGTGAKVTLRAGRKANVGVSYGGFVISGGQEGTKIRIDDGANQDSRDLDGIPRRMCLHGGKVAIATRTGSLFLLGGKWDATAAKWIGDPEPFFTWGVYSDDQDYVFLVSYGGRLYTWLQGQVLEYQPAAGASKQGWRAAGLEGAFCYGATVAANMLVVCIVTRDGDTEVWAFDGTGWWLVRSLASSARCWPWFVGGAGNIDLVVFRDGSSSVTYDLYRMSYRDATYHNFNSAGTFKTSLLDAGERDALKGWRKIGAAFAAPEIRGNGGSVDSVTVSLAYSIDGGATFTTAVSTAVSNPASLTLDLDAALAGVTSRFLQLRVSWSSVSDWAPVLVGVWAEYELLGSPAKRRRWRMKVSPRDNVVQRDGAIDARTGRQQIADLWASWSNGNTVAFRDVDYDGTTTQYNVRIIGISEEIERAGDQGRWGDSTLTLTLVEV